MRRDQRALLVFTAISALGVVALILGPKSLAYYMFAAFNIAAYLIATGMLPKEKFWNEDAKEREIEALR